MNQQQKNKIWQGAFDEYCLEELGGRDPEGREYSDACQHADEVLAEEEAAEADYHADLARDRELEERWEREHGKA